MAGIQLQSPQVVRRPVGPLDESNAQTFRLRTPTMMWPVDVRPLRAHVAPRKARNSRDSHCAVLFEKYKLPSKIALGQDSMWIAPAGREERTAREMQPLSDVKRLMDAWSLPHSYCKYDSQRTLWLKDATAPPRVQAGKLPLSPSLVPKSTIARELFQTPRTATSDNLTRDRCRQSVTHFSMQ